MEDGGYQSGWDDATEKAASLFEREAARREGRFRPWKRSFLPLGEISGLRLAARLLRANAHKHADEMREDRERIRESLRRFEEQRTEKKE